MMRRAIISILIILVLHGYSSADVIYSDNFNSYTDTADVETTGLWDLGTTVTLETTAGPDGSKAIQIFFDSTGTASFLLTRQISSLNRQDYYIQFKAKRTNYGDCGGCKFFKSRAITDGSNYANITFQMDYGSGNIDQVDHGCGSTDTNDQSCGGRLTLTTLWGVGTIVNQGPGNITFDSEWHTYEFYVKLNSNSIQDAEYTMWIDGVKGREVVGAVMRSNNNPLIWTHLLLGDFNDFQGCSPAGNEYELFYDDIIISTTYIGSGLESSTTLSPGINAPPGVDIL